MPPATLQGITERLRSFWSGEGCAELPGTDQPISRCILAPQVFLRLLGTEHWKSSRVQVLRQPEASRYRRNDLYQTQHLEYQVLLKPGEPEIADRVAQSLLEVGFELETRSWILRDLSWTLRGVGLTGCGWDGLLDGVPIARILFLLGLGESELIPAPVEVTYSLELLALLQQQATDIDSIAWSHTSASSEPVRWRRDDQLSTYYLESAGRELLRQKLTAGEQEAARLLEAQLPVPAYESVLGALQAAEALQARGELQAREREVVDSRLSELACACALR